MISETLRGGARRIGAASAPFVLGALAALTSSSPAQAELQLYNQTHRPLSIAIGYKSGDDWVSEGWWNIDPRDCKTVVSGDLTNRYYYYHEADPGFSGENYAFCTTEQPFTITGDKNCAERGFDKDFFSIIDTGTEATSFKLNLWDEIDENTPIGRDKTNPAPRDKDSDFDKVAQALIGWWIGLEDEAGEDVGFVDATTMHYVYDGELVSKFDYRLDVTCPDGSGVDDVHLIIVDWKSDEQSCYGIYTLNDEKLVLRMVPEEDMLHYNRAE